MPSGGKHHLRQFERPPHQRPRIQIVVAHPLAQRIEHDAPLRIARKAQRAPSTGQRTKPHLIPTIDFRVSHDSPPSWKRAPPAPSRLRAVRKPSRPVRQPISSNSSGARIAEPPATPATLTTANSTLSPATP